MKKTNLHLVIRVLLLALVALGLSGCGTTENVTAYYHFPAWLSDGRIIAVKEERKTIKTLGGLSNSTAVEQTYKVVVMNGDGGNEHVVVDTRDFVYSSFNGSPSGNYVAMDAGSRVDIYNASFQKVSTIVVGGEGTSIQSYDWSPDEENLVIQTQGGPVSIYSRLGEKIRDMSSIDYVYAWKYNELIFGDSGTYPNRVQKFVTIQDQVIRSTSEAGLANQYFVGGVSYFNKISKISVTDFSIEQSYPTLNAVLSGGPYDGYYRLALNPINPANSEEVLYADGNGIYVVKLDGTGQRTVRE
ncbi:MAG: hypothetical protein AB7F28_04150 [Candidatus Margulisiibacteriota bacterium]